MSTDQKVYRWEKVDPENLPKGNNVCYRDWWPVPDYQQEKLGDFKGEWIYFNGWINEDGTIYDHDGGFIPNMETVEYLAEVTLPMPDKDAESIEALKGTLKIYKEEIEVLNKQVEELRLIVVSHNWGTA